MNAIWVHLLLTLINNVPSLIGDVEAAFTAIAHGEGGFAKVEKAAATLLKLANDAASATAAAKAPPQA